MLSEKSEEMAVMAVETTNESNSFLPVDLQSVAEAMRREAEQRDVADYPVRVERYISTKGWEMRC